MLNKDQRAGGKLRGNVLMKRVQLWAAICLLTVAIMPLGWVFVHGQTAPKGSITVFTDGLAYPNGRVSRAVMEVSVEVDRAAKLRLLPIMAYGGGENVRDLLRFRGADLAIMNSDVFAVPDIERAYPEAKRKLRYITRLNSQRVFLFARPGTTAIEQLAGKKVAVFGPENITKLTATTLFRLLKVNATIVQAQDGAPVPDAEAILLLEDDAQRFLPKAAPADAYRLLAIPKNPAFASVYAPASIAPAEAGDYGGAAPIDTVSVDTILATFDWAPTHGRYPDVTAFIDGLFAALPKLRRDFPASIWQETDPRAEVLGWRRHAYADSVRKAVPAPAPGGEAAIPLPSMVANAPQAAGANVPAPVAPVAVDAPAPAAAAAAGGAPAPAANLTGGGPLRLSVVPYPPLTDQRVPGGGLIGELTIAAMQNVESPFNRSLVFQWEKDRVSQVKTVLSDKTVELAMPWEKPSCDSPQALSMEAAAFCDAGLASEPIFKVLVLFFVGNQGDFSYTADETMIGRTICLPADGSLNSLNEKGREFLAEGKLTLVRPASLIECLDVVQRGEADAVLTNELEGKLTIARLGLTESFHMADRAVTTQDLHIILAKDTPGAEDLLAALNKGIAKLKSEDLYFSIVAKHLSQLQAGN
jgi:polar amino acid transport system substrate-binding protein